ncbi:MAG TPA: CHAT domain-containing protein [Thermoanaerobaculia bacterium]|jgi:CHAT domain-containing protein/Tfp pilus assembly protein PilF|nr:CHAT domain-containing protein [Thermoanaerobaculia bacterium]
MNEPHLRTSRRARRRPRIALALCTVALGLAGCRQPPESPDGAVIVEAVLPGGTGDLAGLRPGDRIVRLRRAGAVDLRPEGALAVAEIECEQAPRGPVEIEIERARKERKTLTLPADEWRIRIRSERPATAAARAWDLFARAEQPAAEHRVPEAEAAFQAAERAARKLPDHRLLALVLFRRAEFRLEAEDVPGGLADANASLALRTSLAAAKSGGGDGAGEIGPVAIAQSRALAGRLLALDNQADPATAALAQAAAVQSAAAPNSLAYAATLRAQGNLAIDRDDLAGAEAQFQKALTIAQAKTPQGKTTGILLMNLGVTARKRGRLDEADRFAHRALDVIRHADPRSPKLEDLMINLGVIATYRGNLEQGEELLQTALARLRARGPDGPAIAAIYSNLGLLYLQRGDFASAEASLQRALAFYEGRAPGSPLVGRALTNLASAALGAGATARSEDYATRAYQLHRKGAPASAILAYDLTLLAEIARKAGDRAAARRRTDEALAVAAGLPQLMDASWTFQRAGETDFELGDLATAERHLLHALDIQNRIAPGTQFQVEELALLGRIDKLRGRREAAARRFAEAIDILDAQVARIGGSDQDRTRFRALFAGLYRDALAVAVDEGRSADAFLILERFRARSLLDLLAGRDLAPAPEIPAALVEEQRRIDAELRGFEAAIESADPDHDRARIEQLLAERSRMLAARDNLRERLRGAAPRYAALAAPRPLAAAEARRTLEPKEVALAYAVDETRTTLFVLLPEGFAGAPKDGLIVRTLPIGREALRAEVAAWRSLALAGHPQSGTGTRDDRTIRSAGARLYAQLVAPAAPFLAAAARLRISADGPLATLPFSALVDGDGRYLAERLPVANVVSATLAAELRRMRPAHPPAGALVAFGDPRYERTERTQRTEGTARTEVQASDVIREASPLLRFRAGLSPLPGSGVEVAAVAALVRPARVFLGADATEARFLSEAPGGRIVHFAGHALLDPRFPLDSALALSPASTAAGGAPASGDDGLLQAWEIFERLRLSADLVTLSACETALGADGEGEGRLGLTRAFHYAGARTVLSSLWSVSDRSTAELMRRFYVHLGAGEAKDSALAEAQREMLAGPYRHPYYWAAFQLDGDGR